jgi:pyruvate/2-oxoglutarate dehydrogenase complex dihydrolipoamide acyltransferase (E2) component
MVLQVGVKPGETVAAGQEVAVMTAMKMETSVGSPCDGVVSHVAIIKGDNLAVGDLMLRITPADAASPSSGNSCHLSRLLLLCTPGVCRLCTVALHSEEIGVCRGH